MPRVSSRARAHTAVYPGTFDPVTLGHLDIIRRSTHFVDRLVVAVAANPDKKPLFSLDERVGMLEEEIETLTPHFATHVQVEVKPFASLLVDVVESVGGSVIVRGLRAVSDFEYEFTMAGMNARLDPNVETVFLMADQAHQFTASALVKEIARLGGDVGEFIPPGVAQRLRDVFTNPTSPSHTETRRP